MLGSLSAMALGILVVSILLVRSLTAPLRGLAAAADRIGTGATQHPAPETGPREIRQVARAFNDMQARIRRLLSERTQTLAAVSHDLKTPLTRLRLRAEFIADAGLRQTVDDDLDEMERMLDAALAFLRGHATGEETRVAAIGSILETICDQAADAGEDVVLAGGSHAVLSCRPLAIKRALSNLIDNAVKYGGKARVRLGETPVSITVTVDDDGPGIPEAERERVFDPFYRIGQPQPRDRRNRPGPDAGTHGGARPRWRDHPRQPGRRRPPRHREVAEVRIRLVECTLDCLSESFEHFLLLPFRHLVQWSLKRVDRLETGQARVPRETRRAEN